jgi:peroxiredoxin
MKHFLTTCILLLAIAAFAPAEVVNPAPDFSWPRSGSGVRSLHELRGQPVVLVMAPSPRSRAFRKQAKRLEFIYNQLAAQKVVFIAAFNREAAVRIPSDIPWIVVADGPRVAALYGVTKGFAIAVIGKDGNVDFQSSRVQSASKVKDIVMNSFVMQQELRR